MRRASRALVSASALVLLIGGLVHCVASDAAPPGSGGYGGFGATGGNDGGGQDSGTGGKGGSSATGGTGATGGSGGSEAGADVATGGSSGDSGLGGAGAGGVSGSAGAGGSAGSAGSDAGAAYRHTITIDGANDFNSTDEAFSTTSASYTAYITWDASSLYVGYDGGDVGSGSSTKWVFVYVDVDPGAGTGSSTGEQYTSEQPAFPSGFLADYYYAWRTDGQFPQFKHYTGSAWSNATPTGVNVQQSGTYVEMQIPFSALGISNPQKLGIVTFMMNEQSGAEGTYAGLYSGSFTDGYYTSVPIKYYLAADLTSPAPPNSAANRKQ